MIPEIRSLNPYFTGLSILIISYFIFGKGAARLNPYFTGLSILINRGVNNIRKSSRKSQSLFYWIIYSYNKNI